MIRQWMICLVAGAMLLPAVSYAQDKPKSDSQSSDRGNGGSGRNRGNWDPAAMRERWMNDLKDALAPTDDEWKVIQPKLEKVMTAQRDARGGFGGFGRRRDDNSNNNQASNPVEQAQNDLKATLDNKSATSDEIEKKLANLRQAKEKARADLQMAQKDLKEVLTQRQEAVLVQRGTLD